MSEWKKVKLGDVCQIIDGDRGKNYPKNHEFFGSGYCLFLNTGNVTKEGFSFANNQFITKEKDELLRKGKIQRGDLILTTRGTVGNIAYYTNHIKYENVRINSGMVILRVNKENVDASFLYQLVRSKESRTYINSFCTGSAQPQLPIKNLSQICFEIPSLSTQHRIATILSRYDSLIENYQKQIKLLEEAAQRLYKEWFVDLRFPGHENTKIVDGVPEGWTPSQLGQLAEFKRGKTITKKDVIDGDIPVVAGGLEPAYYCNKSNTAERVITISGSGANAGFTRMYFEKVWASDCSFVDASVTPFLHFVYCYLKANKTTIDNMQKGAAQPHVYAKDINSLSICIPIESVLKSFEGTASKYFDTISSFQSQIHLLTEARDRLLPKLMGGEIVLS